MSSESGQYLDNFIHDVKHIFRLKKMLKSLNKVPFYTFNKTFISEKNGNYILFKYVFMHVYAYGKLY